jgi:predicted extracellular nuclease
MNTVRLRLLNVLLIAALALSLVAFVQPAHAVSPDIVISQVYGGGGNSGAIYTHDFIELFNRGSAPVSIDGWSVQYASASGTSWSGTALLGTLQPGQYYLIQEAQGAGGTTPLPTPDATGSIAMSATNGKVALVNTTTALSGSCPLGSVVDFVGFGSANCFEGTGATSTLSNTTAAIRLNDGCTDTDNNAADFAVAAPAPRNSASPVHTCTVPTSPSGVGAANPNTLLAGDSTLLTAAVTPGANPTSTNLTVTCDLTAIGGPAAQAFFDDGTNGDVTAGDNTFSYSTTVAADTTAGPKSLACAITDAQSRSGDASISLTVQAAQPGAAVVISQVYGGGGNSGATLKNDFIELYNRGTTSVDVTGWTVQYASSSGSSWQQTALSGTIAPGKYFLVQEAAGAGGTVDLPTPDAAGSIAMSSSSGKVALANSGATLTGTCPTGLVDLVGYGSANCSETSPTAGLSNTTAAIRKLDGAQDTDNNSADFTVGAPNPRNSLFPFAASGLATPATIVPGDTTLLTVTVTPGTNPASTGISVSCDLSPIGGLAAQTLYDDGTNGDQVAGDNTFSFLTAVTSPGSQNLSCTFSDAEGRSGTTTIALNVLVILPIGTVNGPVLDTDDGTAHRSPYAPPSGNGTGQTAVFIQGVIYENTLQAISNSTNTYKGFFIQNTAATADSDPNTSDGIFVFMNTASTISAPDGPYTPLVGDEVVLSGRVSEYYNMTELQTPTLVKPAVRSGVDLGAELPPAVANPPVSLADANRYWERLQGMRVQVPANSIVLGGRSVFSPADAEIWLARPDSTIAQRVDPYARRAFRDAHPLDDNYDPINWDGNGYRILIGSLGIKATAGDAQALIAPARTFDSVTDAPAGGVNYTFSKYRIEITDQPALSEGPDPAAANPPEVFDRSIGYSIADYNLENLYDYRDNPFSGCDFAGDSGCPAVAPFLAAVNPPYDYVPASDAVYQARLNDIADQIITDLHSPDILLVQEVENQDICTVTAGALTCGSTDNTDGKPDVLQELALKIAALGGPAYDAAFDRDSSDLRGIVPAFLYRAERVELLPPAGDPILGGSPVIDGYTPVPYDSDVSNPKTLNAVLPAGVAACETNWVFPRAPDIALFRVYSTSIGVGSHRDVYVINNHFKSGPDTCVGHRTEQAKYNAAIVALLQTANPDARIVGGGDLNVYPRPDDPFAPIGQPTSSDQLSSLYDPSLGLTNLWDVLLGQAPESTYSYVYVGMAQTLDQMFANGPLLADLKQFRIAHINSDFPADYPGDVARGTSDHDPNVATIVINDPPTVDAGGPYTVNEGSSVTLTATGTDPEGQPLTYAWDLDNDGTFETPGQSVTFSAPPDTAPTIYTVRVQVTDNGGLTATSQTTVQVTYNFAGFFQPMENLPTLNAVKAGAGVPVMFSLGGDKGLNIFAAGYPVSAQIVCDTADPMDDIKPTDAVGSSSLSYSADSDRYNYVWKTEKAWAGTCRQLTVMLVDGTVHQANFQFK